MLRTCLKILRLTFYTVIILFGVTFAASNRARVDLTFWPLPYAVSVPMFLIAIVLFAAGLGTAWGILRYSTFKERMQHRKIVKRMQALENEISGLRSEQLAREQALATKPLSLVK